MPAPGQPPRDEDALSTELEVRARSPADGVTEADLARPRLPEPTPRAGVARLPEPTPRSGLPRTAAPATPAIPGGRRALPRPGERVGPYEVLAELGRGGMGAVYRARELASGREVALKVLLDPCTSLVARERFAREGRIAASLDHAGILRVHAAGVADDGTAWLACELVEGARRLTAAVADRPLLERVAAVRDAARALGHAHRRGVVHRDVKPDNLLVDATGRVRVTDFGLAAAAELERLTQSGVPMGTPAYMAPEQVAGDRGRTGPPTDVWALGVVLHEVASGERPFTGADPGSLFVQIVRATPAPLRRSAPDAPGALEAIALRALSAEPAARYADGDALADDLDRLLAGHAVEAPRRVRRRTLAGVLAALAAVALGVGLVARQGAGPGAPPPRIVLLEPAEGAIVASSGLVVRGRLEDGVGPEVEVTAERAPPVRVAPGGEFRLVWPVTEGDHVLVLHARDAAGQATTARRAVRGKPPPAWPAWFEDVAPGMRPPLPLPDGLAFGARPGEYVNGADGSVLVWVPPGTFEQGAPSGALLRQDAPELGQVGVVRRVTLTRGVFMGKHEVTWRQYDAFCAATGRAPPVRRIQGEFREHPDTPGVVAFVDDPRATPFTPGADHPVFRVGADEVAAYCAWAGVRTPTEAEWERAARGDDGRRYPWGDEPPTPELLDALGEEDRYRYTAPVGSYPRGASPYGCLDMAGNVMELILERAAPYAPGPQTDPVVPLDRGARIIARGLSWAHGLTEAQGADFRSAVSIGSSGARHGFRVARSPR